MVYRYLLMMFICLSGILIACEENSPLLPPRSNKSKKIKKTLLKNSIKEALSYFKSIKGIIDDAVRKRDEETIKMMYQEYPKIKKHIDERYKSFIENSDTLKDKFLQKEALYWDYTKALFWEEYGAAEQAYQKRDFIGAYAAIKKAGVIAKTALGDWQKKEGKASITSE
jgi:hypothetical protein